LALTRGRPVGSRKLKPSLWTARLTIAVLCGAPNIRDGFYPVG
jgi:hypothetical protein